MAELLHLDAAAKLVGKSEVTLRRLVKAGKVSAAKEKTPTGFIYKVDADEIKRYYGVRGSLNLGSDPAPRAEVEPEPQAPKTQEPETPKQSSGGKVRVAVASGQGDPVEYWLKRAETYEDRYYKEVQSTAHLREELGLWKGRAEHAQALLMKLLPGPNTAQISEPRRPQEMKTVRRLSFAGMMVLTALPILLVIGAAFIYLAYFR